jgi:hypothetical protein
MDKSDKLHSNIRPEELQRIIFEKEERQKELNAINQTTAILKGGKTIEEMLQEICNILPEAWQYPEHTVARIGFGGNYYVTHFFKETSWVQKRMFETIDDKEGSIEIFYLKEFPVIDEGPFMKEERHLINNLSVLISGYLNTILGKNLLKIAQVQEKSSDNGKFIRTEDSSSMQLLQKFLNKHNSDRDIYHDLMPYKVREVLLVGNLYDAYIIEKEGRFFEQLSGEYYQLNLSSAPRITGVSSPEEALEKLQFHHYDLIILMMGIDKNTPIKLSQIIRQIYPNVPILLLLNNSSDAGAFENRKLSCIDKVFVWNGDSKVFVAMIKYIEDLMNIENDTKIGLVRVILLVEDSARYYSRFLPILYSIVIEQTQHLIEEVNSDSLYKILRMRARPKILLVSSFEEAIQIFNKYKEYLLCVITDVRYEKNGILDDKSGLKLTEYVKNEIPDLPVLLQSSEPQNASRAFKLKATFINKNSENLLQDLKSFISYYLGFGNFIYRDGEGRGEIAVARSMKEFELLLKTIPEESLIFHGRRNHFSNWFMARGEIQLAKKIKPIKVSDFKDASELRKYMIDVIRQCMFEKNKGKVVNFDESAILDETTIVSLAQGSLGGKGRGLAFISTLIYNFDFSQMIDEIKVRTPITSIIGTDEFENFLEANELRSIVYAEQNYDQIKLLFSKAKLSDSLIKKLKRYLKIITKPIAVRSSSLFEDSLTQPFAGIFDTFLLPNNHPSIDVRLEQMMTAIKLVFASIFSPTAKSYFEAINYKIEEEKMAVIIQEVVGSQYEEAFYPHISGVAQSYNYYPFSHMKPEDGFAVLAVGLGKYVVEGEKTYRYCPVYPNLELCSAKDLYKNSQLHFYAVDMRQKKINLLEGEDAGLIKLEIDISEKHGTLKHSASVYDLTNERIIAGLETPGPRVVNFANIIKYNYIPLSETIQLILSLVEEAMGSPVEIEFAVDLNKDKNGKTSFYLLQIKPLIKNVSDSDIEIGEVDYPKLLLYSEMGMGNGVIEDITDVIYIDVKKFDKLKTEKMRDEIDMLNARMLKEQKKYILIGPGRWGTRDRFIGIPVAWSQISNAKIIVEVSLEEFPLDASLGSHFFHNVISMNVGYFSIKHDSLIDYINWDILMKQEVVAETKYFRHVRFKNPIKVIMDGKKRNSLIYFDPEENSKN